MFITDERLRTIIANPACALRDEVRQLARRTLQARDLVRIPVHQPPADGEPICKLGPGGAFVKEIGDE